METFVCLFRSFPFFLIHFVLVHFALEIYNLILVISFHMFMKSFSKEFPIVFHLFYIAIMRRDLLMAIVMLMKSVAYFGKSSYLRTKPFKILFVHLPKSYKFELDNTV